MLIGSGIVPYILGPEYLATAAALRWLSVLPILKALHYFLSDALTSSGYQGVRTAVQAGVAIFNMLINLWIIPAYSWRGAAWSSIASDALLLAGVGTAVWLISRADEKSRETESLAQESEDPAAGIAVETGLAR
jgi:O-antigen/teichoic acid export membrane protein